MRDNPRKKNPNTRTRKVALQGRRNDQCAPNSLKFMATVEGVEHDGHLRGANGMRWRLP